MKKSIIILLFLIPLTLNAQIQFSDDFSFKKDKLWHTVGGGGISIGTYLIISNHINKKYPVKLITSYKLARRGAWMASCTGGLLWEMRGMMMGKPLSWSDMTYTTASGVATAWLMYGLTAWKFKRKMKRERKLYFKISQRFDDEEIVWDLDNEFLKFGR